MEIVYWKSENIQEEFKTEAWVIIFILLEGSFTDKHW